MLVRTDLSLRQQLVQAAHATLEAGIHLSDEVHEPSSLVLCSVSSEEELLAAHQVLNAAGLQLVLFREPDIGNKATALASSPIHAVEDRAHFSKFPLWDFKPKPKETKHVYPR